MWRLRCDLSLGAILGHVILWALFGLVTCGFALFLFPYSFGETVINATRLVDATNDTTVGKLRCTQGAAGHVLHAFVWWLLTLVTLGIAGLFYGYRVATDLLNATTVERGA
jgi:hypothetical protein